MKIIIAINYSVQNFVLETLQMCFSEDFIRKNKSISPIKLFKKWVNFNPCIDRCWWPSIFLSKLSYINFELVLLRGVHLLFTLALISSVSCPSLGIWICLNFFFHTCGIELITQL